MIQLYPAQERYTADHGWLKSNFSFSFADYYDPNNMNFGVMRVLNDDVVQPHYGFGKHPHREMEIVSIVLSGHLKHEDSTGNAAVTTYGQVQRMSAGTGVMHSEMNGGADEVHFLQMWFMPERNGLEPSYETTDYDLSLMKNNLLPVVSKQQSGPNVADIHQDLTIYMSELEAGQTIHFTQKDNRRTFVFVLEGSITINETSELGKRDSARITEETALTLQSTSGAVFMLIDLP
ncbi:pirin family protein [Paenibacillus sp. N1-5-1-14]|uniref:pirin family protein n=1 Tax=Paenibacillus radicibacter TaxID=2972488 RepID=UPI002158A7E8|nr:pirin family protein [Paenibacillus radicibacter]MCR8643164.1 pirin family protein [Paenibacillus radicibacter]